MAKAFLDKTGLETLWDLIVKKIGAHAGVIATNDNLGHFLPIMYHSTAATGITESTDSIAIAVNARTDTPNRFYGIETDKLGRAFVNVPWTDTKYSTASQTNPGLIKPWMIHNANSTYNSGSTVPTADSKIINVNALTTVDGKYYAVEMDNVGRAFVNVPWTDTKNAGTVTSITLTNGEGISITNSGTPITSSGDRTISLLPATTDELGGIKIGYAENSKNYAVKLDGNNKAYVSVPWTDTNTTYSTAKFNLSGLIKPSKSYTTTAKLTTPAASSTETPTISAITTTEGRYYAVEMDVNGIPFVNVPWSADTNWYPNTLVWADGTTAGPVGTLSGVGMQPVNFPAIPSADEDKSGVITTGDQTFSGTKTLTASLLDGSTAITQKLTDNSKKIATTEFVKGLIGALDGALVYKGVINSTSDIPASHTKGWTYIVNTAGTYVGEVCEVGDMLVCLTSGTSSNDSHWNVIQTNINGAVTGPASATDGQIALFSGATGKLLKAINTESLTVGKATTANSTIGKLTFQGSVTGEFNGSENKTITIPEVIVYDRIDETEIDAIFA